MQDDCLLRTTCHSRGTSPCVVTHSAPIILSNLHCMTRHPTSCLLAPRAVTPSLSCLASEIQTLTNNFDGHSSYKNISGRHTLALERATTTVTHSESVTNEPGLFLQTFLRFQFDLICQMCDANISRHKGKVGSGPPGARVGGGQAGGGGWGLEAGQHSLPARDRGYKQLKSASTPLINARNPRAGMRKIHLTSEEEACATFHAMPSQQQQQQQH